MNTHFVCEGCGGVSHMPKACSTEGCNMKGTPLESCDCTEAVHLDKVKTSKEAMTNEQG